MQIVSLTTDFGTRDYHVAELKAAILRSSPKVTILDVSHAVDSYDIVEAAYNLGSIYPSCPSNSIHIISVYNYYDKDSEFVVYQREGTYFVAPNNGVLTLLFPDILPTDLYLINRADIDMSSLAKIFAHAVGYLSHGLPLDERQFEIYYQQSDPVRHISKDYGEVPIGEVLCLFNSAGYMEIAINIGKASELLSLKKNETIQINFA